MKVHVQRRLSYRTGQIAELCGVSRRTVSKWIDSGLLQGYRLPGQKDRRVNHETLVEFFQQQGLTQLLDRIVWTN